jgi:hypothetical protein
MSLSPLQLIAGATLSSPDSLTVSANLINVVNSYRTTTLIAPLVNTVSFNDADNILGNSILLDLAMLGATNCPALSDSTPSSYASDIGILLTGNVASAASGNSINGFTSIIEDFGNIYLGQGDSSIFAQAFIAATGYIATTNEFILASENSKNYLGSSFTSMNSLLTGNLDEVNLEFLKFGEDLKNLGVAINLSKIETLGFPLTLVQQLTEVAGVTPGLLSKFELFDIDQESIIEPPVDLVPLTLLNKNLYSVMTAITGSDLEEILQILDVTTPNLQSMADLLDPIKIFPNSYSTLTVKTVDGIKNIYLEGTTSVDVLLLDELPDIVRQQFQLLSQSIPSDQALANQCLKISLQQIQNIFNLTLPALSASYLSIDNTNNLSILNQLTTPVPESVTEFYANTFGTGSGPQGTLLISDLMGAASGQGYTTPIQNTISILGNLTNITTLSTVYQRMYNTISGVYGNAYSGPIVIPAGPAAGTYTASGNTTAAANAFTTALISNAESAIASAITNNSAAANTLNTEWNNMAQKIISENANLSNAAIVFDELIPNQRSALLGFTQNLPGYGQSDSGDSAFLSEIANASSLGGQSIIGALAQGRNTAALGDAGIGTNIDIPTTPV